ncbi:F-box/kelch-repeat protein At3g06240-like isoform X2 [Lotus japonicus]|uniref:F-box/kelch-repeat protein At3g06240-like isoform X2 n=1 Tax=Lotus japonicus TaxID=34305 RepID=UPI00258C1F84|nr:F-box/kelch-repeat protein At3g06240-like isoform X2 [Lotus japonicus]
MSLCGIRRPGFAEELQEYHEDDIEANDPIGIRLFSMKTNSWFYLQGTNVPYIDLDSCEFKAGQFLNQALHWLVISYETEHHVIIAFDLVERSLSEIPLSQVLVKKLENKEYYLQVLGECLSLSYPGDAESMAEIWMMKDYKVSSSWTKLFVFPTCNIRHNVFFPICFTKHGEIFGSNGFARFVIFNDKGLLLDQCTFNTYRESLLQCGMYRESLLSLPNASEEASEDDQLMRKQLKITNSN